MFFLFESILVIEALGFGDVKCALATHAYSRGGDHLPTAINDPGPCSLTALGRACLSQGRSVFNCLVGVLWLCQKCRPRVVGFV